MKNFLLAGCALMAAGTTFAFESQVVEGLYATSLSSNGEWCVGQVEAYSIVIKNLVTGDSYKYLSDDAEYFYGYGSGRAASNNGIIVGSTDNMNAAYWEKGTWTELSIPNPGTSNNAQGITPDGSVICGNVGQTAISIDASEIMVVPAVWYRQSDGTYGKPVLLPHPELDFTGRIPEYVTAIDISDDGKTVIGQIVDYSGYFTQPILYKCNDKGEWNYTLIQPELTNPNNVEFPEYPGEFDKTVSYEDYMTADELAAYQQAVDAYWEAQASLVAPEPEQFMTNDEYEAYMEALEEFYDTWENFPDYNDYMSEESLAAYQNAMDIYYEKLNSLVYPEYSDYMTPAELTAYNAAKDEIDKELAEWSEKYSAFEDALNSCLADGFTYVMNNFRLSGDGKFAVTTREATVPNDDPMAWMPFKTVYYPVSFNLAADTYKQYVDAENLLISFVSKDYSILASYRDPDGLLPYRAYIITNTAGDGNVQPLEDFVASTSPATSTWMKTTMTHQVPVDIDYDTWDYIYVDWMCSGIPTASSDLSLFVTAIENSWDYDTEVNYYTYIFESGFAGVNDIEAGTYGIKVLPDGVILLNGTFESVEVYDVAGVNVFRAQCPLDTVATGLGHGYYVVKAIASNGAVIVSKVSI